MRLLICIIEDDLILEELLDDIADDIADESKELYLDSTSSSATTLVCADPLATLPVDHPPEYYTREKSGRRRKRRAINPSFMPEIRIYRKDIRRRYGEMFINVVNNHELSYLESFIREFFRPDCQIIRVTPANNELAKIVERVIHNGVDKAVTGLKEFVSSYALNLDMMPDTILKPQESQVRVKQGTRGSVIMTKTVMKGTRIMTLDQSPVIGRCDSVQTLASDTSDDSSVSSGSTSPRVPSDDSTIEVSTLTEAEIVNPVIQWSPVIPPIETLAEVIFLMTLDDSNHIQQFHVEYYPISEKPVAWQYN